MAASRKAGPSTLSQRSLYLVVLLPAIYILYVCSSRGAPLSSLLLPAQENPLSEAWLSRIEEPYRARCKAMLEGEAVTFSQAYQDTFLFRNWFAHRAYGQGFFVDIGSNDPFIISNTLFFEKCLGWSGLCIEPNPEYAPMYKNRSCTLIPNCVFKEQLDMGFTHSKGVFAGLVPLDDEQSEGKVTCKPLQQILKEQGVRSVDFVSLDVEGAEMDAIRCFPFEEWKIKAWVVETNLQDRFIDVMFLRNNYVKAAELLYASQDEPRAGRAYLDTVYEWRGTPLAAMPTASHSKDVSELCTSEDMKWNRCNAIGGVPQIVINELDDTIPWDWHAPLHFKDECPST